VLNARVLALSILSDDHDVDVVIRGLDAGDGARRPHVGVEVELLAQRQVERHVTLSDGGGKRALEGEASRLDGLEDVATKQRGETALLGGSGGHLHGLPRHGDLRGSEDLHHSLRNFFTDAIAGDERNGLVLHGLISVKPTADKGCRRGGRKRRAEAGRQGPQAQVGGGSHVAL
jgi:hypothetical protein